MVMCADILILRTYAGAYLICHRRISRHVLKLETKIVKMVFEQLANSSMVALQNLHVLRKAESAADHHMGKLLSVMLFEWRFHAGRKRILRYVLRKTVRRLQGMRQRSFLNGWIVVSTRQRRYVTISEALAVKQVIMHMRTVTKRWITRLRHHRFMVRVFAVIAQRYWRQLLRQCVRGWTDLTVALITSKFLFQQTLSHIQMGVCKDLVFRSFELWGGRTKTMLRLRRVGRRLSLAYSCSLSLLALSGWIKHSHHATPRRRRRRHLHARCVRSVLQGVFTVWIVTMADAWRASIRATEKTHQLAGASAAQANRVVSRCLHAWCTLAVEMVGFLWFGMYCVYVFCGMYFVFCDFECRIACRFMCGVIKHIACVYSMECILYSVFWTVFLYVFCFLCF